MVLISRRGLQIPVSIKQTGWFQICLILEAKFSDNSLFNFWRFKQTQGKSTTWKNKWNIKKYEENVLLDVAQLD